MKRTTITPSYTRQLMDVDWEKRIQGDRNKKDLKNNKNLWTGTHTNVQIQIWDNMGNKQEELLVVLLQQCGNNSCGRRACPWWESSGYKFLWKDRERRENSKFSTWRSSLKTCIRQRFDWEHVSGSQKKPLRVTMMVQHISAQPTQSPGDGDSQALEQAVLPSLEIFKAWLV